MSDVTGRALRILQRQPLGHKYQPSYVQIVERLKWTDEKFNKFTAPELVFFLELVRRGLPVDHHFRIRSTYEIDIWLPCLDNATAGIAIECDGSFWHSNPSVLKKDRRRDMELADWHIATLRFDTDRIEHNAETCVVQVVECYEIIKENPFVLTNDGCMRLLVSRAWNNRKNIGGTKG